MHNTSTGNNKIHEFHHVTTNKYQFTTNRPNQQNISDMHFGDKKNYHSNLQTTNISLHTEKRTQQKSYIIQIQVKKLCILPCNH
jgi:serine protease inhibitor